MENGITRRSAIKRMGAAVAGAAVLGTIPSFAREAIGPESFPQDSKPSDDPNASTLKMDYKLVYEGPGHTRDSVLLIDRENHLAISGDAFGSTNLLMTCELSTFIKTAEETLRMMCDQQIYYMLPGHFDGTNAETSKRVYDLWVLASDVLAGRREGEITSSGMGLNRRITYEGVRFNYNSQMVK